MAALTRSWLPLICSLLFPLSAAASTTGAPLHIEFQSRSPEQIRAFYAARGFPAPMVELLAQQCFITVRIHNTSNDVVWLELAHWHFSAGGQPIIRQHRDYWKSRWRAMNMPLASQSTFRWTLLPESLDFQPDEQEGGNIILPRTAGPIALRADFATGSNKRGPVVRLHFDALYCAKDAQ